MEYPPGFWETYLIWALAAAGCLSVLALMLSRRKPLPHDCQIEDNSIVSPPWGAAGGGLVCTLRCRRCGRERLAHYEPEDLQPPPHPAGGRGAGE